MKWTTPEGGGEGVVRRCFWGPSGVVVDGGGGVGSSTALHRRVGVVSFLSFCGLNRIWKAAFWSGETQPSSALNQTGTSIE